MVHNPSHGYKASPAILDYALLSDMWHSQHAPHQLQPDRAVLNLLTPEEWKAELTLVLVIYLNGLPVRRQLPMHVVTTW